MPPAADPPTVPNPRPKPLLVYDGECHFCCRWVGRWKQITGERVAYEPLQETAAEFPEIPRESFEHEVKLIEPDGHVSGGARAVFRSLSCAGGVWQLPRAAYERVPGVAPVTEWAYHLVAAHRMAASAVTRLLWGNVVTAPTYFTARRWFLRALALVYFIAFASLWSQVDGLIGSGGVLPAQELMAALRGQLGGVSFFAFPTLCWVNASDGFLHGLCAGGMALSVLLAAGFAPAGCLGLLWLFYLSLSLVGQTFLSFQWDTLLLEAGFLAIFLAPLEFWPGRADRAPGSRGGVFLLQWLLFKLMLLSGVVKLTGGDATWRGLTALRYHYETQPLPTWIGWHFHQAAGWFQGMSVGFVFLAEIVAPFFIFAPRRVRLAGFVLLVLLQILIAATGNYGFFNLLTAALCLLLLDDTLWPRRLRADTTPEPRQGRNWSPWALAPVGVVFVGYGLALLWNGFFPAAEITPPGYERIAAFRSLNGYGLFRVMTTERPEIILEGSDDGKTWLAYEFRHKPGDVNRAPDFVAPHMPRLDWQMWFAALGDYRGNLWLVRYMIRLAQGSPPALALLEVNPFPHAPPQYVRAVLYDYHFTDEQTRRRTGAWWRREPRRLYCPVVARAPGEVPDAPLTP